jgi:pimeloyl-ACP methyl ester carboxylesterase
MELIRAIAALFGGRAEHRYVPDSGHRVQQERPEPVDQHTDEFPAPLPTARGNG